MQKTCRDCKVSKTIEQFSKDSYSKDGIRASCKACRKKYDAKYYQKNYPIAYEAAINRKLRSSYGITLEQKRQMWKDQNGQCAICQKEMLTSVNCCVDHDHKTSKVRALLCSSCNSGIGHLREDPQILQAAIEYLNKYQNNDSNTTLTP